MGRENTHPLVRLAPHLTFAGTGTDVADGFGRDEHSDKAQYGINDVIALIRSNLSLSCQ